MEEDLLQRSTGLVWRGAVLLVFALGLAGALHDLRVIDGLSTGARHLVLLSIGTVLGAAVWVVAAARPLALRIFRTIMWCLVAGGLAAFAWGASRSFDPATPLLLGLLGLVYGFRSPAR